MDPREKLVKIGNELLDVVYLCELEKPTRTMLQDRDPDSDETKKAIEEAGGIGVLLDMLIHLYERDQLVKEYVLLRNTIEALETPRPHVPTYLPEDAESSDIVPGIHNPERDSDA